MKQRTELPLLGAMLVVLSGTAAQAGPADIYHLGTLGGDASYGKGINAAGQVTGYENIFTTDHYEWGDYSYEAPHAFIWSQTSGLQDLGLPGGSAGLAINDSGHVAGALSLNDWGAGFVWNAGDATSQNVPQLAAQFHGYGSPACAINASGQVVGDLQNESDHAYRWTNTGEIGEDGVSGHMQDLGTPPEITNSHARGINAAGQVTGYFYDGPVPGHAYRWTDTGEVGEYGASGHMQDLGTLGGGNFSQGLAINNRGQITGWSDGQKFIGLDEDGEPTYTGVTHAVVWSPEDVIQDLGALTGDSESRGLAITSGGQVVGWSNGVQDLGVDEEGNPVQVQFKHAALWTAEGSIIDLDAWLHANNPSAGAWTLLEASGINDQGMITGYGYYNGDDGLATGERAFVLDASSLVPEPTLLSVVAGGIGSLLCLRRRRK